MPGLTNLWIKRYGHIDIQITAAVVLQPLSRFLWCSYRCFYWCCLVREHSRSRNSWLFLGAAPSPQRAQAPKWSKADLLFSSWAPKQVAYALSPIMGFAFVFLFVSMSINLSVSGPPHSFGDQNQFIRQKDWAELDNQQIIMDSVMCKSSIF